MEASWIPAVLGFTVSRPQPLYLNYVHIVSYFQCSASVCGFRPGYDATAQGKELFIVEEYTTRPRLCFTLSVCL